MAALEASQADYRAVLELKTGLADTNARVRSVEDGVAEIKDLLVRALDR